MKKRNMSTRSMIFYESKILENYPMRSNKVVLMVRQCHWTDLTRGSSAENDNGLNTRNQYIKYDDINRLIYSKDCMNCQTTGNDYETDYTNSAAGRFLKKDASSQRMNNTMGVYPVDYHNGYTYPLFSNVFAIKEVQDGITGSITNFDSPPNGNQVRSIGDRPICERRLCWTEDNRLQGYAGFSEDGTVAAWYNYTADGKRNLKLTSPHVQITQNAVTMMQHPFLTYPTLYASPLITLTKHGYTKHYFEGGNRICSKIGGGLTNVPNDVTTARVKPIHEVKYEDLHANQRASAHESFLCMIVHPTVDERDYIYEMLKVFYEEQRDAPEPVFYYHTDHLGSTAYLTNDAGQVTQTLNYLPYGEDWVDIQNYAETRYPRLGIYTYNGKETDYESGFHYYGARYHWSELLTGWLSVDPMMDKYPSISPYTYCAWNPVKLVDPDGREIDEYRLNTETGSLVLTKKTKDNFDIIIPDNENIEFKFVSKGILNGEKVGDDVSKTGFNTTAGKQAEGIDVMVYISFNSHRELSAWGYDDNKGKHCLDVAQWDRNEPNRAWSSFTSGEYDGKGIRRFHVHTHPGTKEGNGGFAQPSDKDAIRAQNFMSDYYIISRKHGLSKYDSSGKYCEPSRDKTPDSLLPYRTHK